MHTGHIADQPCRSGNHDGRFPDGGNAGLMIQNPGTDRKVNDVGHQKQHHRRRHAGLTKRQHGQRNAQITAVIDHDR